MNEGEQKNRNQAATTGASSAKTKGSRRSSRKSLVVPRFIQLGTRRIRLRHGTKDMEDDRYAHFDADNGDIVLHPRLNTDRPAIVCHEFIHASLKYRGVQMSEKQEELIANVLGGDFAEFIIRNPKLVQWIQAGCP